MCDEILGANFYGWNSLLFRRLGFVHHIVLILIPSGGAGIRDRNFFSEMLMGSFTPLDATMQKQVEEIEWKYITVVCLIHNYVQESYCVKVVQISFIKTINTISCEPGVVQSYYLCVREWQRFQRRHWWALQADRLKGDAMLKYSYCSMDPNSILKWLDSIIAFY